MLYLEHHSLIRLIRSGLRLCHHTVKPCAFKPAKPIRRKSAIERKLKELEKAYLEVLATGSGEYGIAALTRIGMPDYKFIVGMFRKKKTEL